ncbi:chemotaxis protein CheB [Pontibacter beigongshangensis]|uniref:chemotaxis protein CheB n=1 Tax=Pontibacter beigongshangensis TaxID=2574733 RepID=UPI001650C4DB|nr:chemotaxis protein CheB [Pontibacter beigongshangensis]
MRVVEQTLKVLVADKSSYARLVLEDIIQEQEDLVLVGMAANGDDLLRQMKTAKPDVVLIDFHLPKNNRFFTLKRIYGEVATPVLLLVDKEQLTLELVKQATELGVYGIIIRPKGTKYPSYRSISEEVLQKIRAVRESEYMYPTARLHMLEQELTLDLPAPVKLPARAGAVVVMGASTGGTQAIETIIKQLSPELKACILIAVHLPQRFTKSFSKRLQLLTPLTVVEGRSGLLLKPGKIIIAPGGRNMVVESVMGSRSNLKIGFADEIASLDQPSVDLLMQSVAESTVAKVAGVILTGMGKDGTEGASFLKKYQGLMVAQNDASSAIFGMAKSAIDKGLIDEVLHLEEIAGFINAFAENRYEVSATDSIT